MGITILKTFIWIRAVLFYLEFIYLPSWIYNRDGYFIEFQTVKLVSNVRWGPFWFNRMMNHSIAFITTSQLHIHLYHRCLNKTMEYTSSCKRVRFTTGIASCFLYIYAPQSATSQFAKPRSTRTTLPAWTTWTRRHLPTATPWHVSQRNGQCTWPTQAIGVIRRDGWIQGRIYTMLVRSVRQEIIQCLLWLMQCFHGMYQFAQNLIMNSCWHLWANSRSKLAQDKVLWKHHVFFLYFEYVFDIPILHYDR